MTALVISSTIKGCPPYKCDAWTEGLTLLFWKPWALDPWACFIPTSPSQVEVGFSAKADPHSGEVGAFTLSVKVRSFLSLSCSHPSTGEEVASSCMKTKILHPEQGTPASSAFPIIPCGRGCGSVIKEDPGICPGLEHPYSFKEEMVTPQYRSPVLRTVGISKLPILLLDRVVPVPHSQWSG